MDVEFCGMIPFHTDEHGFDPGRIMDWYLAKLHPENRSLFQMSHKIGKKLDLHEPSSDDVPWFANIGTGGRHWQGTAIPSICKIAGVPVLHNRYVVSCTG